MFDEMNRYVLKDYQNRQPFSSFLPGIAGKNGIPIWCYYNNRGQAVCSFGAGDKNHAIMEFSPAHVAYRDVSRTGFRTFCKINGQYSELFTACCDMHIGMSELEIQCCQNGLSASVVYFGVPEERTAALARVLTIENAGSDTIDLEVLDGMPAIVPYGLNQDFLKNMTQLSKAWMQSEDYESGHAYFRVRASLEDGAVVREVNGGNFCLAWDEQNTLLNPIVQPSLIFGQGTSLSRPSHFCQNSLADITASKQVTSNQFLCCFLPKQALLAPGESIRIYSLYGQAENKELVSRLAGKISSISWFTQKRRTAQSIVNEVTDSIACITGNPIFDAYCRQTYLDNALRGGAPVFFNDGNKTVPFHLYSRKHGDPEREYNYFSLGSEYYAQGNGNYRDVNQNRRCDTLFSPAIGDYNIRTFFDLIQSDGYNPLVLLPRTFTIEEQAKETFLQEYPQLSDILAKPFTPGRIAMAAQDLGLDAAEADSLTARIICASCGQTNADFAEGYWCDHWTYNLDLIESYLAVYPEHKEALLFTEGTCRWYESGILVNPRQKRYVMTENGLRQYYALDEQVKKATGKWMKTVDGRTASSSIMEKILLLCAIKTATLDAEGMGIEMEGGRPGWYDALNGLPALFGSSMAESCELARLLAFAADTLEKQNSFIALYAEIAELLDSVDHILSAESDPFQRWDAMNLLKEQYRKETMYGFQGIRKSVPAAEIAGKLRRMEQSVRTGIDKAIASNNGLIPTYFTYAAEQTSGNMPGKLIQTTLPLFLEGPVRYMKLSHSQNQRQLLAKKVKESGLYDRKLHMYKVNESLAGVSYEAGRALAFTPGWLENESIWLHMEYKYLLELLKSGLYTEFAEAFRDAAIPFQNPDVYGRSPLENVSFIASSANPDSSIHGNGFVARLSGSTAEFLHIWQILFFGKQPFRLEDSELTLRFEPFIPAYLMNKTGVIQATFLGSIPVCYHTGTLPTVIPGMTAVQRYSLTFPDEHNEIIEGSVIPAARAKAVRDNKVTKIDAYLA